MTNSVQANENNSDTLSMHSPNLVDDNVQKIMALFPNCITESEDENGKLKKAVDFDLLRQELSQSLVEGGQERYRLDWPGKRQAILEANSPIAKTLRPAREESVNFDTTENLFIEGDNLDALKLLQESYLGQVKMIYIDPPYNTGNDFIYEDDFAEDTAGFLERSEQLDEEGNRLVTNTESNGRFHSDWLTMMYSRLKLARNLLNDDGVIFISIDDNEIDNSIKICKEIFGSNQIEIYAWDVREKGKMPKTPKNTVRKEHEYIIAAFKKNKVLYKYSSYKYLGNTDWKNPDNDPRGNWMSANISRGSGESSGGKNSYTIINPAGIAFNRDWSVGEKEFTELLNDSRIYFANDGEGVPRKKIFQNEPVYSVQSSILQELSSSQSASEHLKSLFSSNVFDYPKPIELIKRLIKISTKEGDLIIDFFAGTSTTAESVIINSLENNNLKFIMVQLDETIDNTKQKEAYQFCLDNNFEPNIVEISKERIRRAGKKIVEDNQDKEHIENLDIGFRVLKIDSTNMKDVYYTPDEYSQADLDNLESHIKEDRTGEDLLFQVMLDWGVPLSLPIEVKKNQGISVYYVGIDSLVACFDTLSTDLIDEISKDKPLKFVSSELAIAHDQDKANIKARFAQLSPDTQVKFI